MNKRRRRRRIRKFVLWGLAVLLLLTVGGLGAGYAAIQVPLPNPTTLNQVSHFYYNDGSEMARLGIENREQIKLSDVPTHVQQAIVAAEDRTFWENEGVSIRGTLRALWANIRGKELQGGSTITQQYVKNAFLTQERTFSRKMKELVLAVKMDNQYSKDEILEYYLNTIYLGRGAYGIQAAAKVYFNVPVGELTTEQAALIGGLIKAPSSYEPEQNLEGAQDRWMYTMEGLKIKGWYDGEVDLANFPETIPRSEAGGNAGLQGATGTLMTRVEAELIEAGISEQLIRTGGLKVTTTIDPHMQQAMLDAVNKVMNGQPENLQSAAVAIEPGTGRVMAYYGGEGGFQQLDYAADSYLPPGSSFKPYVLGAGIEQGISVNSKWDGTSPRTFPDRRNKPVSNAGGDQCPGCTLVQATVRSLNTTYYALTMEVGAKNAAEFAQRAGITALDHNPIEDMKGQVTNNIGLGIYGVTVLDQATGFATFAAEGVWAQPHFVQEVSLGDQVIYKAETATSRAFEADVAADATYAMDKVADDLYNGQVTAGKTGTHQYLDTGQNSNAWMCGYTPQLASAVWVGNKEDQGPIIDKTNSMIWGGTLPMSIWEAFMNAALKDKDAKAFPKAPLSGDADAGDAPEPSPTPTRGRDDDDGPRPSLPGPTGGYPTRPPSTLRPSAGP